MNTKAISAPVGEQIKNVRKALGMTQQQLGDRVGMSQSAIANIESGKRCDLRWSTFVRVAEGLNCQPQVQLWPQAGIAKTIDDRSTELAKEIIAASSGSTALEMQLPEQEVIDSELVKIKQDILANHRSALWDKV